MINNNIRIYLVLSTCLIALLGFTRPERSDNEGTVFLEKNGIVAMEAEHASEIVGWSVVRGLKNSSGVTMIDEEPAEGGKLIFRVKFNQPGTYTIWALHAKSTEGYRPDQANDCFALFNENKLQVEGGTSCHGAHGEVIGLGTHHTELAWQSRPKTECVEDRKKKVIFRVDSPGTYEFKILSRSKGYLLDKLVFAHEDSNFIPEQLCPKETFLN